MYLFEKYSKDSTLYPRDPKVRATVNQRMYFDMGTLYSKFITHWESKYERKEPEDPENIRAMEGAMAYLNTFLEKSKYVAAEHLTLADFTVFISVICYELSGIDILKFPNVVRWFQLCKTTMPGYPDIKVGISELAKFF